MLILRQEWRLNRLANTKKSALTNNNCGSFHNASIAHVIVYS